MRRITLALLLFSGCSVPHNIDALPLSTESYTPVPLDSVRYVEPAPDGCTSVARLTARSAQSDGAQVREELRARAAEIGADRLVLSTQSGGTLDVAGAGIPITEYSALALRCR